MTKIVTALLLALTASLWVASPANAACAERHASVYQQLALNCPNPICQKPMIWRWVLINGQWVKRWFCPEFTCNPA